MKIKKITLFNIIILFMFILLSTKTQSTFYNTKSEINVEEKDQSSWWWEPVELLSPEFDASNYVSRMVLDNDNNMHIATYSTEDILSADVDLDIFYIKYDYSTKSRSDLELVSTESTGASQLPDIAIDSENNVHVVWYDSTNILSSGSDVDIFYKQRTSAGWGATEVVSTESSSLSYNPSIIIDSSNMVHIAWDDSTDYLGSDADTDIFYKHRSSSGVWTTTQVVSDSSIEDSYEPSIALDTQENILFAWEDYTDYAGSGIDLDIFFRRLNSDFVTWSPVNVVSSESTDVSESPTITNEESGLIHVVWEDDTDYNGAGTDDDIFYKSCSTGSNTWSITEVISIESTENSIRSDLAADMEDYLYVAWRDSTSIGGVGDEDNIFFKYLNLNTKTWSSVTVLTYDHSGYAGRPKLDVDSLGHVHAMWLDVSDEIFGSGTDWDIFYKRFVGVPEIPILEEIQPNPIPAGDISLSWSSIQDASDYKIFRENATFSSVSGLIPINTTSSAFHIDEVVTPGYYYYAIVAVNEYGESLISNLEFIEVIEETSTGFFASLELSELLVFAGIVLGLQLIFSLITYSLIISKIQSTSKPRKGKKK